MALRRRGRSAGRRAALRWWLLSLALTGAAVSAAAALLAVALHVSASASAGAPYRLAKPREAEELRWEQEFAPPQLASPHSRKEKYQKVVSRNSKSASPGLQSPIQATSSPGVNFLLA